MVMEKKHGENNVFSAFITSIYFTNSLERVGVVKVFYLFLIWFGFFSGYMQHNITDQLSKKPYSAKSVNKITRRHHLFVFLCLQFSIHVEYLINSPPLTFSRKENFTSVFISLILWEQFYWTISETINLRLAQEMAADMYGHVFTVCSPVTGHMWKTRNIPQF